MTTAVSTKQQAIIDGIVSSKTILPKTFSLLLTVESINADRPHCILVRNKTNLGEIYADEDSGAITFGYLVYRNDVGGDCIDTFESALEILLDSCHEVLALKQK